MQSRMLVNIALLLFVITLGFFIYTNNNGNEESHKTLTKVNTEEINKISIHHNNRITKLEKNDSHWTLTSPITVRANDFRVGSLLKLLNTPSHAHYDAQSLQLDKYALDKAVTSITFNKTQIDFGIINPLNNYRYVKTNNEVHLIDDHYYPFVSSQIGTLVARTLLPANSKINKLVLAEQTLALNTQDKWISSKEISADAIIETIDHWKNTEAFGVHDYFEREHLGSIEVYIDNVYEPIKFFITDIDPWLIIARPDIKLEYHFNLEHYDSLLRPGAEKQLPDESSDKQESVSPEDFMKTMNEQAAKNARTP